MVDLARHLERLELAARTIEAYTGFDPSNNRSRDIREAARTLAVLADAAENACIAYGMGWDMEGTILALRAATPAVDIPAREHNDW